MAGDHLHCREIAVQGTPLELRIQTEAAIRTNRSVTFASQPPYGLARAILVSALPNLATAWSYKEEQWR